MSCRSSCKPTQPIYISVPILPLWWQRPGPSYLGYLRTLFTVCTERVTPGEFNERESSPWGLVWPHPMQICCWGGSSDLTFGSKEMIAPLQLSYSLSLSLSINTQTWKHTKTDRRPISELSLPSYYYYICMSTLISRPIWEWPHAAVQKELWPSHSARGRRGFWEHGLALNTLLAFACGTFMVWKKQFWDI